MRITKQIRKISFFEKKKKKRGGGEGNQVAPGTGRRREKEDLNRMEKS